MSAFLSGAVIGFAVAAPVGPIGLLCIRTSLENGGRAGFVAGLGAASADAVYAAVCVFALGIVTRVIAAAALPLHLVGGAAIVAIGVRTMLQRPTHANASPSFAHAQIFRTTLLLTLANPATILSFAAIVAGAALGSRNLAPWDEASLPAGVFCGSALWWLLLSAGVGTLRRAVSPGAIMVISRVSGLVLCGFGIAALL